MSAAADEASRSTRADPEDRGQDPPVQGVPAPPAGGSSRERDRGARQNAAESDEFHSVGDDELSNDLNGTNFFAHHFGKKAEGGKGPDTSRGEPTIQWRAHPRTEFEMEEGEIMLSRHERGDAGSKQLSYNTSKIIESIPKQLGVPSHFVSGQDGEPDDGDQTKYQHIQDAYVGNIDKLGNVVEHLRKFDLHYLVEVPKLINKRAKHPSDMFDYNKTVNLMEHWTEDHLTFSNVLRYQRAVNEWHPGVDRQTSKLLKAFLENSCTVALKHRIKQKWEEVPLKYRGGVTYLYVILNMMFYVSRETKAALLAFLKLFKDRGLRRYKGENVSVAEKQLSAVCTRLKEARALPVEAYGDILEGLAKCSDEEFASTFDTMKNFDRVEALASNRLAALAVPKFGMEFLLDDLSDEEPEEGSETLTKIKGLLIQAVDLYHSLNTAGKWAVSKTRGAHNFGKQGDDKKDDYKCWNCGSNKHRSDKCPHPRDQKKYDANRKKWYEDQGRPDPGEAKKGGSPGGGSQGGGGRQKWSKPSSNAAGANGLMTIKGEAHAHCKTCGWNTTHSTKYHEAAMAQGASFNLANECPGHPLLQLQRKLDSEAGGAGGAGEDGSSLKVNGEEVRKLLNNAKHNSSSAEASELATGLQKLLGF